VDTILQVYDQDGLTSLATDDNGGEGAASHLVWQAPMNGTYFVRTVPAVGSSVGCNASYDVGVMQAQPPARANISGPTTGSAGSTYTFTATVSPITTTLPITYAWQATGQSPVTHTGCLTTSDVVSFTWSVSGTQAVTVTASNLGDMVTDTHAIRIVLPRLSLTKTAVPTSNVAYGGTVTYTVVLSATGARIDPAVRVTDTLPAQVDFGRWIVQPAGASVANDEITWNGMLNAGQVVTFTFRVTNTSSVGETVTNTARFSGTLQIGTAEAVFSVAPEVKVYLPVVLRQ
jgi:uncharacterized repeat protein (TIGR01451 family)